MWRNRLGQLFKISEIFFSILTAIISIYLIVLLFQPLASQYLNSDRAIGGDYFNALTYLTYFVKHMPFPPAGWLSFWHEGIPIIGGYPTLIFYAIAPLAKFWTTAGAMELFAIYNHLLFLLTAYLLFRLVSGSSLVSFVLTFILFKTPATYYQLFGEGLVTAAANQWLVPLTLFWIQLYLVKKKFKYLLASSITTGLSLLIHPALGILTTVFPVTMWLFIHFAFKRKPTQLLSVVSIFIIVSILIGSPTLYSIVRQFVGKAGSGVCESPQCWGMYPEHLNRWFTLMTPLTVIFLMFVLLIVKVIKRKSLNLQPVGEKVFIFCALLLYAVAAYFHKINSLASAIFPRRIFWAVNLLLLLVGAQCFRSTTNAYGRKSKYLLKITFAVVIATLVFLEPNLGSLDTSLLFNRPGTIPDAIDSYIVPKYKTHELADLLPEWVIQRASSDKYRFDSLNQQVNHWWNVAFAMPAVRGYSNNPTGINAAWFYFYQVGTAENKPTDTPELIKNRTLFLLDNYGVGMYEDSAKAGSAGKLGYSSNILEDPEIITQKATARELAFYDLSPKIVSPIVSPTQGLPLLVISDDQGYETLLRALSSTGITSQQLLPVKGPENFDSLTAFELKTFPALFLYRFEGNKWQALDTYIKNGGTVFVELTAKINQLPKIVPDFFPAENFSAIEVNDQLTFVESTSPYLKGIDPTQFARFSYSGGPWKMWAANSLRSGVQVILETNKRNLLLSKSYGKGQTIFSGLNLPFHLVDTGNFEEVKLFKNMLTPLIATESLEPTIVERPIPELIKLTTRARGIYFKENFDRGWTARTSKSSLPVYPAGLQFMYIPLNNTLQSVSLEYRGTILTWSLFLMSLGTLFLSIIFLLLPISVLNKLALISSPIIHLLQKPIRGLTHQEHDEY